MGTLSIVLTEALAACGVPDADMTVSLIMSNGVDLNSIIEQVIVSDDGLALFGVSPGSPTASLFRDVLIQALSAQAQAVKSAPLTWSQISHASQSSSNVPQKQNFVSSNVPLPTTLFYVPPPTFHSPPPQTPTTPQRLISPQPPVQWGPSRTTTETDKNIKHRKNIDNIKSTTKLDVIEESELQFLSSMFDVPISFVKDVYVQSDCDISQSVNTFVSLLSQGENVCENNNRSNNNNKSNNNNNSNSNNNNNNNNIFMQTNTEFDAVLLTPDNQLSSLFPKASTSEIASALRRFGYDLELAAAHLMQADDTRKEVKNKRQRNQLKKLQQQQQKKMHSTPHIRVVLNKRPAPDLFNSISAAQTRRNEETESVEFLHKRMEECFRRAAAAWQKGQNAHAGILSEEAQHYRRRRKAARERDANAIFQSNNPEVSSSSLMFKREEHGTSLQIDLHGLQSSEAISRVRQAVESFRGERRGTGTPKKPSRIARLDLITGRGVHSKQRKSRLMPAVKKWLEQNDIQHEVFTNKGFIRARIMM